MSEAAVKTRDDNPSVDAALAARLAALDLPKGGFTAPARKAALARFQAMGLPRGRDEYWRYTDPTAFNAVTPAPIPVADNGPDGPLFDNVDRLRLVFVDGVFDPEASDDLALDGVQIDNLAAAEAQAGHWAADLYGRLENAGQDRVKRPFGALNTAVAKDGALIRVTGKPARPIHLIHRRRDEGADVYFHHLIVVEPGAEVTVLETGMTGARSNYVIEVDVGEGASFHHIAAKRAGHQKLG